MMTGMIQDVTALGQGMEKALGRPFTREKGAILSRMASKFRRGWRRVDMPRRSSSDWLNPILLVSALAAALTTTGCTPSAVGRAGLTVSATGAVVAVVESCGRPIASVAIDEVGAAGTYSGQWVAKVPAPGGLALSLADPGSNWRTITPLRKFDDGHTYRLKANGGEGDPYVSRMLYFRRSDLDGAALGRILVGVPDFDQDPQRWVGEEQFRREACE